ncbi:endo alpha-1,4 polygalactosaminidase [Novosphingobium bradum]|uniref:Endo alpha-1,4 polygalactosaminidase n=1 Tax=Novosphingobium bradum TaxID=1737444 RepID=A0ABV7IPM2_9SPHN
MTPFPLGRRELLAGLVATGLVARAAPAATGPWRWAIDYGPATNPDLARTFDLLVLEPAHPRPIAPLRGASAVLLGYLSLGEVEQGRAYAGQLHKAGALKAANRNWPDARLVDLRHPAWSELVIGRLIPEILAKGYDGIFIDTLDSAEALARRDPVGNAGMVEAAVALLRRIRKAFPRITVLLNRGYAALPEAAPAIDLLLAEAMASRWNFAEKRYELTPPADWDWQAERLRAAHAANPALRLLTLDYWNPADAATIAQLYARERAAGFHPYVATLALDRVLPEPVA